MDSAIDAEFIFALLNSPKFLKYIGDRGVHSIQQASDFIEDQYRQSYRDHGYGLYIVELNPAESNAIADAPADATESVGVCGFVKRDYFEFADVGFAFPPQYEGKGYGFEAANAVLEFGRDKLGFTRVLAITSQDNDVSVKLLKKLSFRFGRIFTTPEGEDLNLFEKQL